MDRSISSYSHSIGLRVDALRPCHQHVRFGHRHHHALATGRVLLYALAAWIAASRIFIGEHYFTDVVVGAILGTAFPYLVREQFAVRRWLFERQKDGGYRIRGSRTQRWLDCPKVIQRTYRRVSSAARFANAPAIRHGAATKPLWLKRHALFTSCLEPAIASRPCVAQERYVKKVAAGWSSPVARQAHNLKVIGSNPIPATNQINELALF